MSTSRWVGVALLAAALAVGGCQARGAPAIVDTDRVLKESLAALRYQRELDDKEREFAVNLDMLASVASKQELAAKRTEFLRELQRLKAEKEAKLNDDLRRVAAEVARAQRLGLVVVKATVPYGGKDITQDIIDRMK